MKRPLIGITIDKHNERPYYESPFGYARAVERAGGLPILIPYKMDLSLIPQYIDLLDGMIFSGGDDLDPSSWGEERNPKTTPIDPDRERWERTFMAEIERRRIPTLGICLGSQLLNVYRGGSMTQFIPDGKPGALEHRMLNYPTETRHPVSIHPESLLASLWNKKEVLANSSHKQCMNKIGRGLQVIATAPDGIVEALIDPTLPLWLGIQWHPERLPGEEDHEKLFSLLIDRSRQHKG